MTTSWHPDWQKFLEDRHAQLSDGAVQSFAVSKVQDTTRPALVDLSHLGLLLIAGADARAFLHGQFTNDVEQLTDGRVHWNGYCSPKGRLLASFLLWPARQGYLLQLPAELVEPVRKRLSMFVLRAKVTLEDVSTQWTRIGLTGNGAAELISQHVAPSPEVMQSTHLEAVRVIRLGSEQFELIGALDVIKALWQKLEPYSRLEGRSVWDAQLIHSGVAVITAVTQEAFVPQMVNFDLMGAVSFKKGCYPGQEIVARTQYRGILKRRMMRAHLANSTTTPAAGDAIYSPAFEDQAAGEVVNAASSHSGGYDLLIVAQVESLRSSELRWKSPDGPALTLQPLPYPVPLPEPA